MGIRIGEQPKHMNERVNEWELLRYALMSSKLNVLDNDLLTYRHDSHACVTTCFQPMARPDSRLPNDTGIAFRVVAGP